MPQTHLPLWVPKIHAASRIRIQGHGFAYEKEHKFKDQLETYKSDWAVQLERLETDSSIPFPGWDDWDERGVLKPGAEGYDYSIRARR